PSAWPTSRVGWADRLRRTSGPRVLLTRQEARGFVVPEPFESGPALLRRVPAQLHAGLGASPVLQVTQAALHGAEREGELVGHRLVAETGEHQAEHLPVDQRRAIRLRALDHRGTGLRAAQVERVGLLPHALEQGVQGGQQAAALQEYGARLAF